MTQLKTLRRRDVRDSARGPAIVAVQVQRAERHRTTGLSPLEVGYGALVVAWLAGGWAA